MTPDNRTFGIYFYGWYRAANWKAHKIGLTPQPGLYDSTDPLIARWQVDQIARTGVDYVVFEMVPVDNHAFDTIAAHVRNCLPLLKARGIGYTFLADLFVIEEDPHPEVRYAALLSRMRDEGWLDNLYEGPRLGRSIFVFGPPHYVMESLRVATPPGIAVRPCIYAPDWESATTIAWANVVPPDGHQRLPDAMARGATLREALEPLGYFPFWQETDTLCAMNGIAPIIARYDDTLLGRDPSAAETVPDRDGQTLVEQFRAAMASGAQDFLVYGWNELFESAVIEPTLQHGDFYVRLTGSLIGQARRGEAVHMPADMGVPRPHPPVYLSAELERSAMLRDDRIPRWDHDDYLATIGAPARMKLKRGSLLVRKVRVANAGNRVWPAAEPVNLGIRLVDAMGTVRREGRTEITKDVAPGDARTLDIAVATAGLEPGPYRALIDMVWDGRFWFDPDIEPAFTVDL